MGIPLTRKELRFIYSVLQSELKNLPADGLRFNLKWAGFDVTRIPAGASAEAMPIVSQIFEEMRLERQLDVLRLLASSLTEHDPFAGGRVQRLLGKQGFQYLPRDSRIFARINN